MMKNLVRKALPLLCLVVGATAAATASATLLDPDTDSRPFHHVRSARIQVLRDIPLAESGWTVFAPVGESVEIRAGFPNSNEIACGLLTPSGTQRATSVAPHWDLSSSHISSNGSTFAKIHARTSNGKELQILCGRGYQDGFFQSMPTVAEVKVLLRDYFKFDFDFITE